MEMAPAMSSAIPPRTTSFESPREERPAVRANGTVSPSERPMMLYPDQKMCYNTVVVATHTSLTTSGSMRVRSSFLSSLQQIPSARECRAHLACRGVTTSGSVWSIGHTGALELEEEPCLWGRGTTVATEEIELSDADMVEMAKVL